MIKLTSQQIKHLVLPATHNFFLAVRDVTTFQSLFPTLETLTLLLTSTETPGTREYFSASSSPSPSPSTLKFLAFHPEKDGSVDLDLYERTAVKQHLTQHPQIARAWADARSRPDLTFPTGLLRLRMQFLEVEGVGAEGREMLIPHTKGSRKGYV